MKPKTESDGSPQRLPRHISDDDITRHFWARLMGSQVNADGQVPGFDSYWKSLSAEARQRCDLFAWAARAKIRRDGRDPDECISAGVDALRPVLELITARAAA